MQERIKLVGNPNFKYNGDDLRRMRLAAQKTTQQMADLVGISRQTYENYENGVSRIPWDHFQVWCKYCDIDLSPIIKQFQALRSLISDTQLRRKSPTSPDAKKVEE
ncbi:XRE family transcriptional regulator [Pseudoalteromonas sp. CO348]|uniref:helix-turn-helix domain-containing protein n=1 Tax=Pseudoalteromonas sp. CO348 TaxID=1777271 RepID=UPI001023E239|nr:helix-turn-helix transcriptional regulator [Pseudoalteromonas sp. CO348]RZG01608.1 XRE family transcriptional regulator [Pseudoalteromonas sp. CO348]